jgi:crotonobetainyl-CoA:carnitine CoA-transferase CaiB-like acyl-CoA transferase
MNSQDTRLPLRDVTVLDLSDEGLVFASRLLAALGARVIRVEPLCGDTVRTRPPFANGVVNLERSLAHILYNAGKQSLAVAFDRPEAWDLVARVAPATDVVIAPMEASPLTRRFLDSLRDDAPPALVDAVLCRDTPQAAVSDLIGTAAGGLLYLNGFEDDPPNVPAGRLAYKQASLAAAVAAMSLVMERRRVGGAGHITVSMQEAVTWTTIQTANLNYWPWHHTRPHRQGIHNVGGRTIFPARDGRWVSFYLHPPYWDNYVKWAVEVTGSGELAAPEWRDRTYRYRNGTEILPRTTEAICQTRDRDDLVLEAQRRSLLVVPVQTPRDIASDAHLRERGFFQPVSYPQFDATIEVPRPPFRSSAYTASAGRAPALGEHTRVILRELAGMSEAEIDGVVASGVAAEPAAEAGA